MIEDRVTVGIPGLDVLTCGGLPRNRLTLVAGTAGSGKTVFAAQFLATGIAGSGEAGVFVTFEERPESIRRNMRSFGWDIEAWEAEGRWVFVDASPRQEDTVFAGDDYDLSPLIARIDNAVARVGATRVAIDSIGALVSQFANQGPARRALFRLGNSMEATGVTTVMTAERPDDYGPVAQLGFEEFLADNVIVLRNGLTGEKRRRTLEVLKMRGSAHLRGEHLFTLLDGGIVVVPVAFQNFEYGASTVRYTSGVTELDEMLGGGLFEKSLWLVAGPTGTGKSLLVAHFVAGGVQAGQRVLLHSFEESRAQLGRNAAAWGIDFDAMEEAGMLRVIAQAPESAPLEDHLQRMKLAIDEFEPGRVAIDSLTALQRIATVRGFREYVLGLTFYIKLRSLLGLVTSSVANFLREEASNDLHVSTISDAITLLHYLPVAGEMRRGVQVLKLRGSDHDKAVREFTITDAGMQVHEPFSDITPLF
jgi:circadian clock protein KaiC